MDWILIGALVLVFLLPTLFFYALKAEPAILLVRHVVDQVEGETKARVKAALRRSRVCGALSAGCGVLVFFSLPLILKVGWWWKPLVAAAAWLIWKLHRGFEGGMYRNLSEVRNLTVQSDVEVTVQRRNAAPLPLFLYLRPFELDQNLEKAWTEDDGQGHSMIMYNHLEDLLENVHSEEVQWVAFGEPRAAMRIGIGSRNRGDEEWWEDFVSLASKATRIFIVPAYRGGGLKEIRWLVRNGKIESCVFIRLELSRETERHWTRSLKALRRLGISLPPPGPWGLFTINWKGRSSRVLPLRFEEAGDVRRQLDRLESLRAINDIPQDQRGDPSFPLPNVRLHCPHIGSEIFLFFFFLLTAALTLQSLYSVLAGRGFDFYMILFGVFSIGAWFARRDVVRGVELGTAIRIHRAASVQEVSWEDLEYIHRERGTLTFQFAGEKLEKLSFKEEDRDSLQSLFKAVGRPDLGLYLA